MRAAIARCHPCGTTLAQSQPLAAHHRQCGQTASRRVANLVAAAEVAAGRPRPCGATRSRWAVVAVVGRPHPCGATRNQRHRPAVRWEPTMSLRSAHPPWYATPRDGCSRPCQGCSCPLASPPARHLPPFRVDSFRSLSRGRRPKAPARRSPRSTSSSTRSARSWVQAPTQRCPPPPPPPRPHPRTRRQHTYPHLDLPRRPAASLPSCRR